MQRTLRSTSSRCDPQAPPLVLFLTVAWLWILLRRMHVEVVNLCEFQGWPRGYFAVSAVAGEASLRIGTGDVPAQWLTRAAWPAGPIARRLDR